MGSGGNITAQVSGLPCAPCSGESRRPLRGENGRRRGSRASGFVSHLVCPEVWSLHLFLSILTYLSGPFFPDGQRAICSPVPPAGILDSPESLRAFSGWDCQPLWSLLCLSCLEPSRRGDTHHCHQGAFQGHHCQRSLQATVKSHLPACQLPPKHQALKLCGESESHRSSQRTGWGLRAVTAHGPRPGAGGGSTWHHRQNTASQRLHQTQRLNAKK